MWTVSVRFFIVFFQWFMFVFLIGVKKGTKYSQRCLRRRLYIPHLKPSKTIIVIVPLFPRRILSISILWFYGWGDISSKSSSFNTVIHGFLSLRYHAIFFKFSLPHFHFWKIVLKLLWNVCVFWEKQQTRQIVFMEISLNLYQMFYPFFKAYFFPCLSKETFKASTLFEVVLKKIPS